MTQRAGLAPKKKINVLIVDDSAAVREAMTEILNADPELSVMGSAANPFAAARLMRDQKPDVITLDVEMPKMDGITFLRKLNAQHPIPVVMCSSLMGEGSSALAAALEAGAIEAIEKPRYGARDFLEESRTLICDAVRGAARARLGAIRADAAPAPKLTADAILPKTSVRSHTSETLVALGASTGGSEALKILLERLPHDAPPILIVQHMPAAFTSSFASRLDGLCNISVKEAEDGDVVRRGQALLAPGGRHMLLRSTRPEFLVTVQEGPLVSRHRPSVDVLFRSVAQRVGRSGIGIIMTGMGDDGARGLLEMKEAGGQTLGQNEASCAVYGMPAAAMRLGAVDSEASPSELADLLLRSRRP
jgi:two-component system chemotaxis response regulator CheB